MNKIITYKYAKKASFEKMAIAKKFNTVKEENKKFMKNFIMGGDVSIYCDCIDFLIKFFILDFLEKKVKDFDANDIEKLKKINATLSTCVKELEDVFGLGDDDERTEDNSEES